MKSDLLVAALHRIERLKSVLEELACLGGGGRYGNSDGNMIAQKALKELEDEE